MACGRSGPSARSGPAAAREKLAPVTSFRRGPGTGGSETAHSVVLNLAAWLTCFNEKKENSN